MLKLHCDVCDAVIKDSKPRVRFQKYPPEVVDVTICEKCLSQYTLLDIVTKFERKKF